MYNGRFRSYHQKVIIRNATTCFIHCIFHLLRHCLFGFAKLAHAYGVLYQYGGFR